MKTYKEKLLDPRWQKKRLKVFNRDEFRCQLCWNDKETLHVHHKYYKKCNPWEYPLKALITLCSVHHLMLHPKMVDQEKEEFKILTPEKIKENKKKSDQAKEKFFKKYRKLK